MTLTPRNLLNRGLLLGVLSVGIYACGQSNNVVTSTGGTTGSSGGASSGGTTASGGTTSTGGTTATGGTTSTGGTTASGGTVATGGTTATGGVRASGGTTAVGSGGIEGTGGSTVSGGTTGTGGAASGGNTGDAGLGGTTGPGGAMGRDGGPDGRMGTGGGMGMGGTTGTGGSTAAGGSTGSGSCVKGQVKASEVVFMGESFYAISPQYNQKRVESNAKKAGAIGANDSYRNVAVSGQTMNYVLVTEWPNAIKSTTKVVIMDGGGIDCMSSSCSSCPGDFTTLLGKMATAGVQEVIYTRYPEPGAPPGSNATLKGNLDILMPKMQTVCESATGLKCHWVDLRPVWKDGDTTDGLHPTQSGGDHVGDAIWAEMVKDCIAQ